MTSVALNCPSCGASESIAAPHGERICEFCGTRYLVRMGEVHSPAPAQSASHATESPEEAQQWTNLAIIMGLMVFAVFVGFLVIFWLLSGTSN
ncbi:MAG: hypothetical protein KDB29_16085 [Planctomycetes bacterium]|nr:hypothetical protein [Planctomycetota bacterium]